MSKRSSRKDEGASRRRSLSRKKQARVTIDDVHAVYRSSKRVTEKQLDALERELAAELPRGYRAFLTRCGHGWINDWLQIYCPDANLLKQQRESLVRHVLDYTEQYTITFDGAKLTEQDMRTCVQVGINQDLMQLFACRRFPGSLFEWSGYGTIAQHRTGIEVLDPFVGMRMDRFAYFFPLEPVPELRSLACQSKLLAVQDVVESLQDRCNGPIRVIDVDEVGSRSPAFWLFPENLGVKLHVYGVEAVQPRRIYLTFGTSPKLLSTVCAVIEEAADHLGENNGLLSQTQALPGLRDEGKVDSTN